MAHFPSAEAFRFFHVDHEDFNQHLDLNRAYADQLHPMQTRKLTSAAKQEIRCVEEAPTQVEPVHQFISKCREQNGLEINISLERLQKLFAAFPKHYRIFSAFANDRRIASVVTCQVTPRIAYYYLPATDDAHKSKSPMVALVGKIFDHYKAQGLQVLDLGISSVKGEKQEGLFTFKERLGAEVTTKTTYTLEL